MVSINFCLKLGIVTEWLYTTRTFCITKHTNIPVSKNIHYSLRACPKPEKNKTGFEQVKIMKEFA